MGRRGDKVKGRKGDGEKGRGVDAVRTTHHAPRRAELSTFWYNAAMMLNSITLLPATQVTLAERTGVLNAAYADYHVPFHMTQEQVAGMDALYDVDLALSPMARVGVRRRGWRCWRGGAPAGG